MYLEQVYVRNLLSFDEAMIPFGKYNVIVGPNNSGKTNLLRILNMFSENERLDHFQLKRNLKLDPEMGTLVKLTVRMEEHEARMIFQCIFGVEKINGEIHEQARTVDVTVVWSGVAQDTLLPRFTRFRFHNGFGILLSEYRSVAFDSHFLARWWLTIY